MIAEKLNMRWSSEQIAAAQLVGHETINQTDNADKAKGGDDKETTSLSEKKAQHDLRQHKELKWQNIWGRTIIELP